MKNYNFKKNWWVILLFFLFPLIITAWVYLVINFSLIDLSDKNNIGDALGGITNPIIGFFGIIVTFLAFYIQYQFNKDQSSLIAQQKKESDFNYLSSEFLRIEKKVIDFNNSFLNLKDDKIHKENSHHFIKLLSEVRYLISIFNNLIRLIDLNRVDTFKQHYIFIDKYDRILLSNIYFLDKTIFRSELEVFESLLKLAITLKFFQEEKDIIHFKKEVKEYNSNLESIKVLLFAVYD